MPHQESFGSSLIRWRHNWIFLLDPKILAGFNQAGRLTSMGKVPKIG